MSNRPYAVGVRRGEFDRSTKLHQSRTQLRASKAHTWLSYAIELARSLSTGQPHLLRKLKFVNLQKRKRKIQASLIEAHE